MKKISIKLISLMIAVIIIGSTIVVSGVFSEKIKEQQQQSYIEHVVENVMNDISYDNSTAVSNQDKVSSGKTDLIDVSESNAYTSTTSISFDLKDYMTDVETFVYGLIQMQLQDAYDVFPGYVTLSTGQSVYGLGLTKYEAYLDEDKTYFMSSFISFPGEIDIPEEDYHSSMYIFNLDFNADNTHFVYAYETKAFKDHAVVFNQYITYGVEEGQIFFNSQPYEKSVCDESLGSLYSYDLGRFLYDDSFGSYVNITGESLSEQINYNEIVAHMNEIIKSQDEAFYSVDIDTCIYYAYDAILSYFLSTQEESFLGISVDSLVEASRALDDNTVLRIGREAVEAIGIEPPPPPESPTASNVLKWVVGIASILTTAACVCLSCVFPALSVMTGVVAAGALEIFSQVVLQSKSLEQIDTLKLCIACVFGGIAGAVAPALNGFTNVAADAILGGTEMAVLTAVDGGSAAEIALNFGVGVALGGIISAGLQGMCLFISKISNKGKISKIIKNNPDLFENPNSIVSGKVKVSDAVGGSADDLGRLNKSISELTPDTTGEAYVRNEIRKQAENARRDIVDAVTGSTDTTKSFQEKTVDALTDNILDANGKPVSKATIRETLKNSSEGALIGKYDLNGYTVEVRKINGVADISFDDSFQRVSLSSGIQPDRQGNLILAAEEFRKSWIKNPDLIPESIKKAIIEQGKEYGETVQELLEHSINGADLYRIIQKSEYVLHESADLSTVTLVLRQLHDKANGYSGISHCGGVSLSKFIKQYFGSEKFNEIIQNILNKAS